MSELLRLLFIGDIVGPAGRSAIAQYVPALRDDLNLDAVIANGENAADNGFGVTPEIAETLLQTVDFITLGDHAFDQEGIGSFLDSDPRIVRPVNFEQPMPGHGTGVLTADGARVGLLNVLGRVFMRPKVNSPFTAADQGIQDLHAVGADIILVDMQAEATSEKQGMGWYLAGRVAAVLGTHTHVPTADLRILPGGTAYVSDVGMTGGRDSIIGFSREGVLASMMSGEPRGNRPAEGRTGVDAILIQVNRIEGRAVAAERIYYGE
ncbi:MAG: YmdB family metallophosphoesterase [Ktedonobacterales bacterium]